MNVQRFYCFKFIYMSHDVFQINSSYGLAVDVCYNCVLLRVQRLQSRDSRHFRVKFWGPPITDRLSGFRERDILDPTFDDRLRLCSINILTLSCIAAASSNVSGRLWLRVVGSKQSKFVINIEIIEIVGGWYSKTINDGVITPPKPAIELNKWCQYNTSDVIMMAYLVRPATESRITVGLISEL